MLLSTLKKSLIAATIAASILYPFGVYFLAGRIPGGYLVAGILLVLLLRTFIGIFTKKVTFGFYEKASLWLSLGVCAIMGGLSYWNLDLAPFLFPVVMSLFMMSLFAITLLYPPSLIERFARITEPNLDEYGIAYTKTVTKVWVAFCLINASISAATVVLQDSEIWALYNGFISYLLMGALFLGEYTIRRICKSRRAK